ncbi:MAG: NADH-quinone oxidoreductase subunit L [Elusimicrobia bacterium]|nr:MAG: NADH-quinone oxidoreductase subunit L [Elusimicrobiota bacterium]
MLEHAYLIPIIPFVTSLVILLGGKEGKDSKMPYLGIAAMGWCFLQSSVLFFRALSGRMPLEAGKEFFLHQRFPWLEWGENLRINVGVLVDGPAVTLLFVVTLVSLLVQIYSLGYMHDDKRKKRYYAYLSFFTASMLGLVIASSIFILFACWELVGVSSYLLIGFWFEKPGPAYASKKAFITTKLADCGFYVGLLILFCYAGTFDLVSLKSYIAQGLLPVEVAKAVGIGFLIGAIGKSAQIPLFIWLPDAMEGPTPVSALIHAATMVVAGIYLVARTYFIFTAAPTTMGAVAWVGLFTAFFAATMAITAYDIKKVLAYSTVSQLGYMMLGLGVYGYTAALFHLTTHAFFKALLFLGAGSVIHAVHTNDMREMGGLYKRMPTTAATVGIATLTIAGLPLLSGWWSKEAILHDVYAVSPGMWVVAVFTAGLTAFYMSRMYVLTFLGAPRNEEKHSHAHESPLTMKIPLWTLAVLSLFAGGILHYNGLFEHLVHFKLPEGSHGSHHAPAYLLPGAAIFVFAVGVGLAYKLYSGSLETAQQLRGKLSIAAETLEQRYYFDDFFLGLVKLSDKLATACYWIDSRIIDAIFIDGWALVLRALAAVNDFIDSFIVDGAVDGVGTITQDAGWGLRKLVRGQVQEYLLYVSLAVAVFATFMLSR